jgi:hypothetical protein
VLCGRITDCTNNLNLIFHHDVRQSPPMMAMPALFGESADYLTKEKADQGVGRGRGRPPHQAAHPHHS